MAGRRPKPTNLHILQGGRKKTHRPLPKNEPQPKRGIPKMPRWLKEFPVAVKEWKRESKELHEMGIITMADPGILANRCYLASQIQELAKDIKKEGRTESTIAGGTKANPKVTQLMSYLTEYRQTGNLLGFDPSSRSRIKVPDKPKEDPTEDFLSEGKSGRKRS